MRIGNLLRQEQTVTRKSASRIIIWVGELSWDPEARIGGDGQRDLVLLQVFLSE